MITTWDNYLNKYGRVNSVANPIPDSNYTDNLSEDGGMDAGLFNSFSSLVAGNGSNVAVLTGKDPKYRIWVGAKKPTDAPFSVDKDGNVIATSLSLSGYLSKTDTGQTLSGSINVGTSNVLIDGVNNRIVINDGTYPRIVIGNI